MTKYSYPEGEPMFEAKRGWVSPDGGDQQVYSVYVTEVPPLDVEVDFYRMAAVNAPDEQAMQRLVPLGSTAGVITTIQRTLIAMLGDDNELVLTIDDYLARAETTAPAPIRYLAGYR